MCGQEGCPLLVDTGTYLNFVPTEWFRKAFPQSLFNLNE